MLARKYGLASDRLVGIEMVDASGKLVTANKTLNPDLLWAHRGGGGGEAPTRSCSEVLEYWVSMQQSPCSSTLDGAVQAQFALMVRRQLRSCHEAQGGHC